MKNDKISRAALWETQRQQQISEDLEFVIVRFYQLVSIKKGLVAAVNHERLCQLLSILPLKFLQTWSKQREMNDWDSYADPTSLEFVVVDVCKPPNNDGAGKFIF